MQREIYTLTLGRGLTVPWSSYTIITLYAWNSIHGLINLGVVQILEPPCENKKILEHSGHVFKILLFLLFKIRSLEKFSETI
jgi:hypothetical protein